MCRRTNGSGTPVKRLILASALAVAQQHWPSGTFQSAMRWTSVSCSQSSTSWGRGLPIASTSIFDGATVFRGSFSVFHLVIQSYSTPPGGRVSFCSNLGLSFWAIAFHVTSLPSQRSGKCFRRQWSLLQECEVSYGIGTPKKLDVRNTVHTSCEFLVHEPNVIWIQSYSVNSRRDP